jgi:hypothetical protein
MTPEGGFLTLFLDRLFRNEHCALKAGETVSLRGMKASVKSLTEDGRPAVVKFEFDRALEDSSLCWISWQDGKFVPYTPPAVGETRELHTDLSSLVKQ